MDYLPRCEVLLALPSFLCFPLGPVFAVWFALPLNMNMPVRSTYRGQKKGGDTWDWNYSICLASVQGSEMESGSFVKTLSALLAEPSIEPLFLIEY